MNVTGRLIQVPTQEIILKAYQAGLQAMWEARWRILGADGEIDWAVRHGSQPSVTCPLLVVEPPREGSTTMEGCSPVRKDSTTKAESNNTGGP